MFGLKVCLAPHRWCLIFHVATQGGGRVLHPYSPPFFLFLLVASNEKLKKGRCKGKKKGVGAEPKRHKINRPPWGRSEQDYTKKQKIFFNDKPPNPPRRSFSFRLFGLHPPLFFCGKKGGVGVPTGGGSRIFLRGWCFEKQKKNQKGALTNPRRWALEATHVWRCPRFG